MEAELAALGREQPVKKWVVLITAATCFFVTGLAVTRLIFEWRFPTAIEFGRPLPVLFVSASLAALGAIITGQRAFRFVQLAPLLPLLLNLVWLSDPATDLSRSRFLFVGSLWLVAVLFANQREISGDDRRWRRWGAVFIALALLPVYLLTMSHAVGEADTFEFQVVAPQLGIAHPTGYPLYLLLGKVFSLLPWGTVAWRLNLASTVFALVAAIVLYLMALRLLRQPLAALTGVVILGLTPIFWSQAIIAEVYMLHALIVAVALRLMIRILDEQRGRTAEDRLVIFDDRKALIALAFTIGLGLTNHLTTLFLLPAAAITFLIYTVDTLRTHKRSAISAPRSILWLLCLMAVAFLVPLLIYAYLPVRWQAVNGEPMGLSRFVDWVIGGRFQDALQWDGWRRDSTRPAIVGRLFLTTWGWFYLVLAVFGLVYLFKRFWQAALILLLTAVGFTFYALNYYVPDLAVFLIPTHLVIAVWIGAGVGAVYAFGVAVRRRLSTADLNREMSGVLFGLLCVTILLPAILRGADLWSTIDQSSRDGGETWATGVLGQPLQRGAAILADSEKIAPLYYLQQVGGLRPDLDIMVLPDEAAYRSELERHLAAGQTVYLARFLPGLEGTYHLRSAGPLVEVSRQPLKAVPNDVTPVDRAFGPIRLLGYQLEPEAAIDPASISLTLYWTLDQPLDPGDPLPILYVGWTGQEGDQIAVNGRHPVSNYYPINAWRPGEVVVDTHYLTPPVAGCEISDNSCWLEIQVAVAPRFMAAADLQWQTVTPVDIAPSSGPIGQSRRTFFDSFALDGVDLTSQARPGTDLPLQYSGFGPGRELSMLLIPAHATDSFIYPADNAPQGDIRANESTIFTQNLAAPGDPGPHVVVALPNENLRAVCHWLAWPTTGCVIAEIDISGVPIPEGAVNFDDRIALLDIDLPKPVVEPGGQLLVEISWQGLAPMIQDYTVFVQVLDAQDRIVGQVDAWPVQGTLPTSQWHPGQVVRDPYIVHLSDDIEPGEYRILIGLYLLETLERLPVLDDAGQAVDDRVELFLNSD
jgi:hypothetical protein